MTYTLTAAIGLITMIVADLVITEEKDKPISPWFLVLWYLGAGISLVSVMLLILGVRPL